MLKTIGIPNRFDDIYVADDILLGTNNAPAEATPGQMAFGNDGLILQKSANVAANGTLDLTVNTDTYFGNPGGFSGTLIVTSTRGNFPPQSRRVVYAAMGVGTTATFTQLGIQDGSGGGSVFSLSMSSNGVIRFTDTSGQDTVVSMSFFGSKALA